MMSNEESQVGMGAILRPSNGYQAIYEGKPVDSSAGFPLYLTEGPALDDAAGEPNYDVNLMRGLPVPMGSELVLWIPNLTWLDGGTLPYEYMIIWRLRSVADNRRSTRPAYHFRGGEGVPDTSDANAPERLVIPAAYDTIVYDQADPATSGTRALQTGRAQDIQFSAFKLPGAALNIAGTEGAVQQGVADPTSDPSATRPSYLVHRVKALGDEILIGIKRARGRGTWEFGATDADLAAFFDSPQNGVYVFASNN